MRSLLVLLTAPEVDAHGDHAGHVERDHDPVEGTVGQQAVGAERIQAQLFLLLIVYLSFFRFNFPENNLLW